MPNFDLSVEAISGGRYRITVTESPAGTASTEIDAPFTLSELAATGDSLTGRAGLSQADQDAAARAFGEKLFGAVFSGPVNDSYMTSLARAGSAGLQIRVRLDMAGLLADLPWGLLRDPKNGPLKVSVLPTERPAPRRVGGLREVATSPRLLLLLVLLIILGTAGIALARRSGGPINAGDADLTISSLRFFPRQPSPGQKVTVTIGIQNIGTGDSGRFKWAWFRSDPQEQDKPDLVDEVANLAPGATQFVKGDVLFGWWGEYTTTAWVNFDAKVSEKSFFNNLNKPGAGHIVTSDDPFVIDFTLLPDASPLLESKDLSGDEFKLWGLAIKTDPGGDPTCSKAIVKLLVIPQADGDINQLATGLPNRRDVCTGLPLAFTLTRPVGSAAVDFVAAQAGIYTLDILDNTGKSLKSIPLKVDQPGPATVKVPADGSTLNASDNAVQVVFHSAGATALQKLTLGEAAPVPSP